jgi:RHS repeat-associated protein
MVLDADGNISQSVTYIPYGEIFVEERNGSWNSPYLFNSKELDEETGLYYYGARYLNPTNGMWLSTDPLFEKYVGMSPYNYCVGNPVKLVDPDGRDAIYIVFPDYKISAFGKKWEDLGHAGVLLIDNKSGVTKYYEYGRWDKEKKGITRNIRIPDVKMGKDGKPTNASLNKVLREISKLAGQRGRIEGAYISSDKFKDMNEYAQKKIKENNDPQRKEYSLFSNNCGTFAADVVNQDTEVNEESPSIIDPRPTSIIKEFQDNFKSVQYNSQTDKTIVEE